MKRLASFGFIFICSFLFTLTASANNILQTQQQRLHELESIWNTPKIPAGMPPVIGKATSRTSGTAGVSLLAQHVDFIFTNDIGFTINCLTASFEPLNPKEPVNLDDPRQFIIHVHSGEIVMPPKALAALFNKQILTYWPRPLNNMRFRTGNNVLVAEGGLKLWSWFPFVWLPARLEGNVVLSQDNKLVYIPNEVKLLGIPMAGLLRALGIKLSLLLTLHREGVQLVGSQLVLNHRKVFPPPAISGRIESARLDQAGLHLTFNDNPAAVFSPPKNRPDSFIWIQSGDVKLFNTIALNANILIKDENPNGNLRFDLYHYRCMIASKNFLTLSEDGVLTATLSTLNNNCLR